MLYINNYWYTMVYYSMLRMIQKNSITVFSNEKRTNFRSYCTKIVGYNLHTSENKEASMEDFHGFTKNKVLRVFFVVVMDAVVVLVVVC